MKISSVARYAGSWTGVNFRDPPFGRALASQSLRFLLVGASATVVNWMSRLLLSLVLSFEVSVATAYGIGMVVGFVAYRNWVFYGSQIRLPRQLLFFALVNAAGLAVVIVVARAVLSLLFMTSLLPNGLAQGVAHGSALAVAAIVNFLGHRSLSFARGLSMGPMAADA